MVKKATKVTKKYIYAKGRRKKSVATIRLFSGKGDDLINSKPVKGVYNTARELRELYLPLSVTELKGKYHFTSKVLGGGKAGQLDAIVLAISRALVKEDSDLKAVLKQSNLMTVDSRRKERKKPGLKKARKKEQYSKR